MSAEKSGRIDDPLSASYNAWPEEREDPLSDAALATLSPFFERAHMLHLLKEMLSNRSRVDRICYLLDGFRLKIREIESSIGALAEEKEAIRAKIDSPQFKEAVLLAMDEASRTLNQRKIDRYASVLAGSLEPDEQVDSSIDLSTLIRDISQLGDEDIRVLEILRSLYAPLMAQQPNFHDPNPYTEKMDDFRRAITNSKLHSD